MALSKGVYRKDDCGILTNKDNIDDACDPPGTRKDKKQYDPLNTPTKILFGFAHKLYEAFPYME